MKGTAVRRGMSMTAAAALLAIGCSRSEGATPAASSGISPQQMADALHAVMESDRIVYTKNVVNRLQNELGVIKATEHWQDEKTLPLPAQMFRMGAELASAKELGFTYSLISMWPVNKQNRPRTEVEKAGLQSLLESAGKTFYAEEKLGDKTYFTAVYPDFAVAPACIDCHNKHKDSPRSDFKMGDVMGGVVVRIQLGS